jgi:hypothetical protein
MVTDSSLEVEWLEGGSRRGVESERKEAQVRRQRQRTAAGFGGKLEKT